MLKLIIVDVQPNSCNNLAQTELVYMGDAEPKYVVVTDVVEARYVLSFLDQMNGDIEKFRQIYIDNFLCDPNIVDEEALERLMKEAKENPKLFRRFFPIV